MNTTMLGIGLFAVALPTVSVGTAGESSRNGAVAGGQQIARAGMQPSAVTGAMDGKNIEWMEKVTDAQYNAR